MWSWVGTTQQRSHCAQTKDQLTACVERRNRHTRPSGAAPLGPRKPRAPAGPARKSTRLEGRPAPIYNESALEKADGIDRKKRSHLPEHHGVFPTSSPQGATTWPPWMLTSCLTPGRSLRLHVACSGITGGDLHRGAHQASWLL